MNKSGKREQLEGQRHGTDWVVRATQALLVLFMVGLCSRGYGYYNQTLKATPQVWMDVVRGTSSAPEQYRVGVVMAADWITRHTPLRLSEVFGIFDVVSGVASLLLLYRMLRSGKTFRESSLAAQWCGSAAFAALAFYLLDWLNWYQKVGTLPTTLFMALTLWLWTPSRVTGRVWRVVAILALVVLQSLIRADVAAMVCAGVLIASSSGFGLALALPQRWSASTAACGLVIAAGVQAWLMKVAYPHASYGAVPMWMLAHDWWRGTEWASALIFVAPFLWSLQEIARGTGGDLIREGANAAFVIAGVLYIMMWLLMGRLDEVRIFLPMALALIPLTVEIGLHKTAVRLRPHERYRAPGSTTRGL